jgi:putative ABC transport system permease protein
VITPRWRKVLRDAWLHKPRTLLVILAIIVGIVGAGSVLNAWTLIRQVTKKEFADSNPASATLRTDAVDDVLVSRVKAVVGVRDARARRAVVARLQANGVARTAELFVLDDFLINRIGRIAPEQGIWPPADGSIIIERSSVDFAGVLLGDSVHVQVGSAVPTALTVTGIARDVGLAPGWMDHIVYGFVTRATAEQLGAPSQLNELQVVVAGDATDRDAVRRIADRVKILVESTGHVVVDVNVPVPGRHIHAGQIESLLVTQGVFGLLALLMSGVLVVNLISAMLAGQVREIGIMKAIGATDGQLAGMYLGLALVLGLIATVAALPAAALIGRAYAQFTADLLNFSVAGIAIPTKSFALQLVVGLLLPVCAAAIPVTRGCRISVSAALHDFGTSVGGAALPSQLIWRLRGLSRPALLSVRNAFRRRQRMTLTLCTLALGGAVYLGALNLRASIIGSVDLLFKPQHYNLSLSFAKPWAAESLEMAINSVPGVVAAEAWSASRGAVEQANGGMGNTFPIAAPPAATTMLTPKVRVGRWFRPGDRRALVVNAALLADDLTLKVGSEVTLILAGQRTRWMVIGVAETGLSPMAFAPREGVAELMYGGGMTSAVVAASARDAVAQSDLVQRLRSALARRGYNVTASRLVDENRRELEDHLLMVAGFLGVMAKLMIVVGGLGLAATMSLAVLERTREIGVMRAIGATNGSIFTVIHVEGLVIALLSWAIAVPLSLPMSLALGRAFGRIMLPIPITYVPNVGGVLNWLVVVAVVSVLACAWPAWRATRITTAAALAYE